MHHNIMSYLIFGLVEVGYWGGGGFFIGFSFRLGNLRLHTENQLCIMPGTALKVCVGGGGWVVLKVNLVIDFGYSLALAKPKKTKKIQIKLCLQRKSVEVWGGPIF